MEVEWARLTASELREAAEQVTTVIVPIGSVEQHGPHLPVMVDMRLAGEIARRAAQIADPTVRTIVSPTVWTGLADHHVAFGGTFTVSFDTLRALLTDICRSIAACGFGRILILNGHGGNTNALKVMVADLENALGIPVITCTYWSSAADAFAAILETQKGIMHACEGETSMMLALEGDLVKHELLADAHHVLTGSFSGGDAYYRSRPFDAITPSGVIGDARRATAAKGERLLEAAARGIAAVVTGDAAWSGVNR